MRPDCLTRFEVEGGRYRFGSAQREAIQIICVRDQPFIGLCDRGLQFLLFTQCFRASMRKNDLRRLVRCGDLADQAGRRV